jgi:asparagine synthase (glutamine-hydrolysing)
MQYAWYSRAELEKMFCKAKRLKYSRDKLKRALEDSVKRMLDNYRRAALLFSGGVDSCVVGKLVSESAKVLAITVGTEKSVAVKRAKVAAEALGLKLSVRSIKTLDSAVVERARKTLENAGVLVTPLQLKIAVPQLLAMEHAKVHKYKIVFVGSGADELFCGYDEFRRVLAGGGYVGVEKLRHKKLLNFEEQNLKREVGIARALGLELKAPFLTSEVIELALSVPVEKNLLGVDDLIRKHELRKLAVELGIPKKFAYQRKKAIQFDSGIEKTIKALFD